MHPLKWLRKLSRNERGNALIVCAATLPLVIGSAAIGVDTIQVSLAKRQIQRAADSAAIAGAYAKHAGHDVNTAVTHDLTFNNDVTLNGAPLIENAPTVGTYAGNTRAVRVRLTAQRVVPFIRFFTRSDMTVTSEATAMSVYAGEYCMVSLEDGNVAGAIDIGGSATVNLGCGMISNSTSSSAVEADGSSYVTASPVAAVGTVPAGNYAPGTVRMSYSPAQVDPFANLPHPTVPGTCNHDLDVQPQDNFTISGTTNAQQGYVSPGVYCWDDVDIKGTVVLPPDSVIYVNGGQFNVNAGAHVTGERVTIILTSATAATDPSSIATLSLTAGAELDLTAPDSGTYSGVVFYQDRRAPYATSTINGNSSSFIRGAFYFPSQQLVLNGTAGMSTECVQLVGRRLGFTGTAAVNNNCPSGSGSGGWDAIFIRLVA